MTNFNGFVGTAKRLDDLDLPRLGSLIGVGEDELHAFMEVETSGKGFDDKKRPKMLFEPHVFYRLLPAELRATAVAKGLAYPKWGQKPYPLDSYPRLIAAIQINEEVALKSASWGLGQIMGYNHELVGYPTVCDMIYSFMEDEENHLKAIVDFLVHTGIDDDLRAHRWEAVARVYNGPQYAKHGYHIKMARAYVKWQGIRDTPYTPPAAGQQVTAPPVVPAAAKLDHNAAIEALMKRQVWQEPVLTAMDGALRKILVEYTKQLELQVAEAADTPQVAAQ